MTYYGPPNREERTRNQGRRDYNRRSFQWADEYRPDVPIDEGAGIRRRKDLSRQRNEDDQPEIINVPMPNKLRRRN